MPQGNPRPGEKYRHFKENLYQVVTVAEHSETGEALVIYQALYGEFKIYARPLSMFLDTVDREKYPDAEQEFRFQLAADQDSQISDLENHKLGQKLGGEYKEGVSLSGKLDESRKLATEGTGSSRSAEEKLMAFFDADTMEEKYKILLEMRDDITDRMVNNMAVALDVVVEEGPIDQRYEDLKICVRTFQRYECNRLR